MIDVGHVLHAGSAFSGLLIGDNTRFCDFVSRVVDLLSKGKFIAAAERVGRARGERHVFTCCD